MDKSWMKKSRVSSEYINGVNKFLDFAFANTSTGLIPCACKKCVNLKLLKRDVVQEHLIIYGIMEHYTLWKYHGETSSTSTPTIPCDDALGGVDMNGILHDAFGMSGVDNDVPDGASVPTQGRNAETENFFRLLQDADRELYPGCTKFTKLSFIVRLYHIKCLSGWSNKSFDMLLTLLKEALPEGELLPKSFYDAKKIIRDLGLNYNKIDACPNDCMLYWKDTTNDQLCKVCGTSRWQQVEHNENYENISPRTKEKKIPAKILRYFPLVPRLQRLFMSTKTASFMRWHDESRTKDGSLRHPADSLAWKDFDIKHRSFSLDSRNVRLGLATDGFNPFRTMSISHSTWPVILTVYNLPPWMCMKQPYLMLSLLIPGPCGPGNDIDVYLQPLIDDLKQLWEFGVDTYDAHSNQTFQMKAALLWTISDFPGYAMLSGWSTKGRLACPCCNKDTCSRRLKHGRKFCYLGHRRFLPTDHRFRFDKRCFNGEQEHRIMPIPPSGYEVLEQVEGMNITFGKISKVAKGRKRGREDDTRDFYNWKKKSIFFDLPYWKHNLLRHSLDVMHIEKNVCDNVIGTLLNIEGKTKDNLKARLDLQEMKIRNKLHPISMGNKTYYPPACFTMSNIEKEKFCNVLKNVKVPDGYAANISRCVHPKKRKISGLKSHDCHVLMQQLLPIALRGTLVKHVSANLIELCTFFRELCSKVARVDDFERLQSRIVLTLCHLERIFPPAFFDVMVHLPVHLAAEARIAGPVHYRWMYPIERYLLTLKSYVRNRSRPEGSIAEGYLAEECLTFCSKYFDSVETRFNRPIRNDDFGNTISGRSLGKEQVFTLDEISWRQANRYMLFNSETLVPYFEMHRHDSPPPQHGDETVHLGPTQIDMTGHSDQASDSTSRSTKTHRKRVRGNTRLESLWNIGPQDLKTRVRKNNYKQPIGNGAKLLGQFLGTAVRKPRFISFMYSDWKRVPIEAKENIWQTVQGAFDIDADLKSWVLESFNKKWKDHKSLMKTKYYLDFVGAPDEAKKNLPPFMDQVEWDWLVQFWESKVGKTRGMTNKANRKNQKMHHTSGTKSFARKFEEETEKNNGVEPSRMQMFIVTHTRKDQTFIDAETEKVVEEMRQKENESQLSGGSQSNTGRNDIFSQVMGEDGHGRVRQMGMGVRPSAFFGPQPTRQECISQAVEANRRADEACREVAATRREAAATRQEMIEFQTNMSMQLEALMSFMSQQLGRSVNMAEVLRSTQASNGSDPQP